MATGGGLSRLFMSIAIITTIIAGFLLFPLHQLPATETMDKELVRFYVECMRRPTNDGPFESAEEASMESVCRDCIRLIWLEYQSSGRLGKEFLESLKIYHNYNQTDVDILICSYDHRRCPDRVKALKQRLTSLEIKNFEDELRR